MSCDAELASGENCLENIFHVSDVWGKYLSGFFRERSVQGTVLRKCLENIQGMGKGGNCLDFYASLYV